MAQQIVNITATKAPSIDTSFTQLTPTKNVGPVTVLSPNQSLVSNIAPTNPPVNVATWNVMTAFDSGLKSALISFINTTKEGVKVAQGFGGRTKIINFYFTGNSSQTVAPAEIGTFSLQFSYPPGTGTVVQAPQNTSVTQNTTVNTGASLAGLNLTT